MSNTPNANNAADNQQQSTTTEQAVPPASTPELKQQSKGKSSARGRNGRSAAHGKGSSEDKGDSEDDDDDEDVCFICADPVEFYAVGECDHRTCYLCNLRLRALFKSKACPYCKTDSEQLSTHSFPYHDEKLSIKFDSKDAYDKAMYALQFNCPQRRCHYVDQTGWQGLKDHARQQHSLMFCDLCLKNKMSFAHEHKLFTKSQLRTHNSRGDNSGFPGHPMCEFCRTSFYDNDQLFDHCRKKHEQCFICVQSGAGRQVYFKNYQTLEDHFNTDHFPCRQQTCIDRKFVVFGNELDLQAHELETHGSRIVGQRARREARQVNINIHYSTNRAAGGSGSSNTGGSSSRGGRGTGSRRPETMMVNEPDSTGFSSAGRHRPAGFGQITEDDRRATRSDTSSRDAPSSPEPEPERQQPQTLWPELGAESSGSAHSARAHPTMANSLGISMRERAPTDEKRPEVDSETMSRHQELLQRVSTYLSHREQPVARFRKLTTQYKDNKVSAADYVQNCWLLFLTVPGKNAKEMIQKTMKSVAELLPEQKQRDDLLKAWSNHRVKQQQFPALAPLTKTSTKAAGGSSNQARVLVIKQSTGSPGGRSGWASPKRGNVSPSQSVANITKSLSSSSLSGFPSLSASSSATSLHSMSTAPRATPVVNAYSSKVSNSIGTASMSTSSSSGSRPRVTKAEFPGLPPSTPARRKFAPVNPTTSSAWGSSSGTAPSTHLQSGAGSRSNDKSKNAKGKNVLFRLG
ncbi:hypothetical protein DL89DRAFT_321142 [Linderina pennispora]|uniref:RING-type E3 ubiquitin transferase n=1 Tax=Linderina pennispora TaxID=61395 RepID=A0A1Y1WEP5_9FUNG|nr:E3 ubiquitin-protein ligase HEL2 [Linderina pennispora]ORX72001.1 hypothetical protein DL89DRAFT_321142 [Linderina pennispora]